MKKFFVIILAICAIGAIVIYSPMDMFGKSSPTCASGQCLLPVDCNTVCADAASENIQGCLMACADLRQQK